MKQSNVASFSLRGFIARGGRSLGTKLKQAQIIIVCVCTYWLSDSSAVLAKALPFLPAQFLQHPMPHTVLRQSSMITIHRSHPLPLYRDAHMAMSQDTRNEFVLAMEVTHSHTVLY